MRGLPQEKDPRRRSGNDPAAGELGGVDRGKPDGAPLHSGCLFGRYSVVGATRIGLSYSWLFCPAERIGQSCVGSAAQVVRKLTVVAVVAGDGDGGGVGVVLWRTRRVGGWRVVMEGLQVRLCGGVGCGGGWLASKGLGRGSTICTWWVSSRSCQARPRTTAFQTGGDELIGLGVRGGQQAYLSRVTPCVRDRQS
jgi:hypothetical protein